MIPVISSPCEAAREQADACHHDPRLGAGDACLEILGKATVASEPSEGAFDDPSSRLWLEGPEGLGSPDETAIDAMPSPVVPPTVEVALHGRARRKFSPERPPLTAGSKNVKNGIHYGSQIRRSWASYSSRRRHQRLQQRPFRVCRVACKAKAVAPILQASDFSPRHGALHRISQIRRNHIRLKSLTSFSARL